MGKRKFKQKFLALPENGRCIYCGKKSETVDHFPPRIFFRGKNWPETYCFPACEACNSKKSHDEQALAYIVKEQDLKLQDDEAYQKILKGVRNNEPWIIDEVKQLVGDEAKQGRRDLFGDLGSAVIFPEGEYGIFRFGEKGQHLLKILPHWLGRALYFLHTKDICPGDVHSMILKPVDLQKKTLLIFSVYMSWCQKFVAAK
ncbi:hypothetical protein CGLAMM_11325 [Acetobacteraceae bacterium EV16G]|uniref:HNH endonuclease n=1 Tax=Sorlinia euscelidii TaxID=3081148 RepID=A0ABU7U3C0_9PROT